MMGQITIKDIAKLAGVSCATVSRALNGAPSVDPETRNRVLALCRQYGYRKNLLARSLSASRAGLIGCILSDLNNPLFSEMALLLEQSARRRGCHVLLCHGRVEDTDIEQVFDFLIGHRVDGIILVSSSRQASALIRRYMGRVPILLQGSLAPDACPEAPIPSVAVDNLAGGRLAAEYLYGLGHRHVAYLGLRSNNQSLILRHQGFAETALQLGMTVRTLSNDTTASNTAVGYQLARQFFFEDLRETAIFAACDTVALGVMAAAGEFHVSIPGELSLLGFDNISYAALPNIRLSTLTHQSAQVVEAAVRQLLAQVNHTEPLDGAPLLVTPALVKRASCRELQPCASSSQPNL